MILKHLNKEGYIQSYFEWDIVDESGKQDMDAEFMYVRDIWVHPDVDGEAEIVKYIGELNQLDTNANVKYIYWKRHKTGKLRLSKSFTRDLCVRKFVKFARRNSCSIS